MANDTSTARPALQEFAVGIEVIAAESILSIRIAAQFEPMVFAIANAVVVA